MQRTVIPFARPIPRRRASFRRTRPAKPFGRGWASARPGLLVLLLVALAALEWLDQRFAGTNPLAPIAETGEIRGDGAAETGGADRFSADSLSADSFSGDQLSADFALCHSGGGANCVVDGDTFWFGGEKIRIADIDTPETHGPQCAAEAALGDQATARLHDLLDQAPFSLESAGRDTDRYGRKLRIVTRSGASLGDQLIAEGLARRWDGARRPWC